MAELIVDAPVYECPDAVRDATGRRQVDGPYTPRDDPYQRDVTRDEGEIARQAMRDSL